MIIFVYLKIEWCVKRLSDPAHVWRFLKEDGTNPSDCTKIREVLREGHDLRKEGERALVMKRRRFTQNSELLKSLDYTLIFPENFVG
jgi:hypothetical protein